VPTKLPFIEVTAPEMTPSSPRSPRLSSNQIAMSLELKDKLGKKTQKDISEEITHHSAVVSPPQVLSTVTVEVERTEILVAKEREDKQPQKYHSAEINTMTVASSPPDDDSKQKLATMQSQIKELHHNLNEAAKEKRNLEAENTTLKQETTQLKRENRDLTEQLQHVTKELNSKTSELDHRTEYSHIDLSSVHSPEVQDLLAKLEDRNKERLQYKELLKELQENLDKKTKERSTLKEQIKQEQDKVEAEAKRRSKIEEYCKELERKLEIEMKKRIEFEREIDRRDKIEENLKKELEKAKKRIYEEMEQDSSVDVYNRQLELDLEKMRRRIETTTNERDTAETDKFRIQQEVEELKDMINKVSRDRDRAISDKEDLAEEVVQLQRRLQTENKERREAEQLKNALLEYKAKFNQEWEEKIALESQLSSQERELIGLKKKMDMEMKARKAADETVEALERTIAAFKEAEKGRAVADTDRKKQEVKLKDDQEELQRTSKKWQEIESANAILQSKLDVLQHKYDQETHKLALATKQISQLQRRLDEESEPLSRGSLEAKYIQLKKEFNKQQLELEEAKDVAKRETQKRDEILVAKVKLEKTLQQTRKKLDKLKEGSFFTPSPTNPSNAAPSTHRSAKPNRIKVDSLMLKNMTKEDLQSYVSELVAKLEEEALTMMQLEQENHHLQLRVTAQIENESKIVHQLQDTVRALEVELEKANSVIHFQHQEFTVKVKELEDTRQRLLASFIKSPTAVTSPVNNTKVKQSTHISPSPSRKNTTKHTTPIKSPNAIT
jgi:chromosome segregation ATPase